MRLFFVLLAVISSCWLFSGNSFPFEHPIPVSASIAPLADLVSQVGGEFVKVQLLVPNGSSPHTYEPKPSDIKALSDTRALFLVGGGLEMFAPDMVKATEKMFPVIEVNSGIEIINGSNNGASSDPGNTAGNPHIWLSLRNAQIIVRNIANALSQIDPAGSTKYRENAELYIQKLEDLDAWFRKESEKIAVKDFVTQHAAWVYFARDYGFVQKGVIADTPGKEPSPKEIRKLVDTIKNLGISVIFAEPQLNQKAAETLAQETGMKVAILDPLGRYPDQPYLELMKTNMQIIIQYMK